jgi:hypothetical protein
VPSVCESLQQNSRTLQEVSDMIITHSCSGGLVPTHIEFHHLHSALHNNLVYFKLCTGTECLPSGRENTFVEALNEYQDKSQRICLYFGMEHNSLFMFFSLHQWTEFQTTFCGFHCCTLHSDIYTVHSPTNALLFNLEEFKIYIKIHINIPRTCFGLRPSSGSL